MGILNGFALGAMADHKLSISLGWTAQWSATLKCYMFCSEKELYLQCTSTRTFAAKFRNKFLKLSKISYTVVLNLGDVMVSSYHFKDAWVALTEY